MDAKNSKELTKNLIKSGMTCDLEVLYDLLPAMDQEEIEYVWSLIKRKVRFRIYEVSEDKLKVSGLTNVSDLPILLKIAAWLIEYLYNMYKKPSSRKVLLQFKTRKISFNVIIK